MATEKKGTAQKAVPATQKAAPQKGSSGRSVTVTQHGSASGHNGRQIATLKGLGLHGRHSSRTLEDTPAVRGMIAKVKHLVRVEGESR